ncbi:MAG: hypothetical protein H7138_06325, partial [Myxococcales bacterium]|nr:hypothetical protein [Myxococcales bacterium]
PVPELQRELAPPPPPPPPPGPSPSGWWALAKLDLAASPPSLTLDLANSLPVEMPGRPLWSAALGTLSLAYVTGSGTNKTYTNIVPSIDYTSADFLDKQSGLVVVTDFGSLDPKTLATLPLAVTSTTTVNGSPVTRPFLEECAEGWSVRADQFIYRMNPGMPAAAGFAQGETNTVDFYVRKFGEVAGTAGTSITLSTLTPSQAAYYTVNTLGTGGTNGINANNLSTPQNKLTYSAASVPVQDGKASVTIRGLDPGNPRSYVDGQVYFGIYNLSPAVSDFYPDPNDLLSVQIYQQRPITGDPTWSNGIGAILRQYGMLYPIMGQFQLWTYQGVSENREKIQRVLGLDISQPLHMPVTRDLSAIKCKLILDWFAAGLPYEQLGPAGSTSPGTSWNNLPAVSQWGPLTGLVIRAGDIIDSIAPVYGTQTGPAHGGTGGTPTQVSFAGDPIVAMSGVTGAYFGYTHVAQLTFTTAAGKTLGPYGSLHNVTSQQPFDLRAPSGCHINSFFGATYTHSDEKTFVSALGANVLPTAT